MADEGLHEVQLNGKQLVFLFIVGTVFVVVVFLSGVMVGRGLRTPVSPDLESASAGSTVDPTREGLPAASPSADGTPVSAGESLSYAERLESPSPARETLDEPLAPAGDPTQAPAAASIPTASSTTASSTTASATTASATAAPSTVAPVSRPSAPVAAAPAASTMASVPPPPSAAVTTALTEPAGNGFVVQVMAVNTRAEADTIAKRLVSKGYPTFVTTTGAGAKVSYRVRVGKYDDKREADAVSARLQKEEQFNPWVTR